MSGPDAYRIFHEHMASWPQKRLAEWKLGGKALRKTPQEATEDFANASCDLESDEEIQRKARIWMLAHRIHKNPL